MTHTTVTQSVFITATPQRVWDVLTAPDAGARWRNAHFATDWTPGTPFAIEAMIGSKRYRDKGHVLRVEPPGLLEYSYWSRVSGLPDVAESYSVIAMVLESEGEGTVLTVSQSVPPSPVRRGKGWEIDESSGQKHVTFYWRVALPILKRAVEAGDGAQPG